MGGSSGCCAPKNPNVDAKFEQEAQTTGHLSRQSNRYNQLQRNEENESLINKEQWSRNHINNIQNREPNKKRGSITELIDSNNNNDSDENILLSSQTRTRGSYDDDLEIDGNNNSKPQYNNNYNNNTKHHKKKKKKHKHHKKNKLILELKKCLIEFNESMKNDSIQMLMSTENTMNEYNQNELLVVNEICKYFRNKKYDIQWFLCTKRNKFIIIMVNAWSSISILTTIKIFNMLQEKIHKITPSVSKSTLNLVTELNSKNISKRNRSSHKQQENIMFTWKDHINDIDDCDVNHFLYIASLVIKNENRPKLQKNALFKTSKMGEYHPLYNQYDILAYLFEIKMNGYLFRGINEYIFQVNIDKFVIENDGDRTIENEEILIKDYCDNLYSKINTFDISKIYKQSTCTIEFTLSNSKRWESVSSLIKTMPLSEYNVDLQLEDESDDEEEDDDNSDEDESESSDNGSGNDYAITPRTTLEYTKNIAQVMMDLRAQKDNMSTDEYVKKKEILEQQLAESLQIN